MMKNIKNNRSKVLFVLLISLCSSTAFLVPSVTQIWTELSEAEAQKQMLNIPSWAPLVEKCQPAVVVITTEALVQQPMMEYPGLPGPFRFFMPTPPEKQRGQGSGFIFNKDGYILTNQHVIEDAQKIKVIVGNNPQEYDAQVIGSDETLDIAIIKLVNPDKEKNIEWPFLPLGDSDSLRLGDPIMALGSPMGLLQSVNTGIVSHKQRGGLRPSGRDLYVELVQIQVPINPGNSGGPVTDTSGRVVGISESILAAGQSIAFMVPINIIKEMIPQLITHGKISKSFLGIEPRDLTAQDAKALGLGAAEKGAVVIQVMPQTPAEKAGLKPMDVLLEIDGKKITSSENLRNSTALKGVGQVITLKIFRKGQGRQEIKVKLEQRPGETAEVPKAGPEKNSALAIDSIGLEVINTPEKARKELGLNPNNPGAFVVRAGRAADVAGLKSGDVITEANSQAIKSAAQLKAIVDKAPPGSTLLMMTRRGSFKRFIPLQKAIHQRDN
jgi:serine protease Do